VVVALGLATAVAACATVQAQQLPSAATNVDPTSSSSGTSSAATSSAPPTSVPGPGGTTVPVFQPPYPFGTPQAKAPATTDGKAPVVTRIDTTKPYVFITMDDGVTRDPNALRLIRDSGAHPTLFLNNVYVSGHADYFRPLADQGGAAIEDHTITHPNLKGKSYDAQKKEICGDADDLAKDYGKRPTLFRPPFGNYDDTTRKAAADCGMKAVVNWTAAVNDGHVQFQVGKKLRPGDIVLMHFRPTFVPDFLAFLNQARQDGLTPVPLTDFLS
jgi:peptidoglycan/xylan/chitin deacetylase (PgdA/CDA1 family)